MSDDVFSKSVDELRGLLVGLRSDSLKLRIQKTSGQLQKTSIIKRNRRQIARVLTALGKNR
jgi:ribosomal protein L29